MDERGTPAVREGGTWVLDEARRWRLQAPGGPYVVRLDAQTLPWEGDGVDLHLPFAVGRLGLQLEAEGRRHAVPVRVRPAPAKVDETAWEALLAELEAWLPWPRSRSMVG